MQEILGKCGFRCDLCPATPGTSGATRIGGERATAGSGTSGSGSRPRRPCAEAKELTTCASCDEFPCADLNTRMCFLDSRREEIARLEPGEYETFYLPHEAKERLLRLRQDR